LPAAARGGSADSAESGAPRAAPSAVTSAIVTLERRLQQGRLRLPAWRGHRARLAFGRGFFAQLGDDALRIYPDRQAQPSVVEPVQEPRAVLALADGSLLAVDARRLLSFQPGSTRVKALPRPVLLPDAELYADALRADTIWVFEPARGGAPAKLSSFVLGKSDTAVPLPEQSLELSTPSQGVLGVTGEGVWLYLTPGQAERLAPGGGRLPALKLDDAPLPAWVLPAPRIDHSLWLNEAGELWRVQVSPSFRRLERSAIPGRVFAADVGDRGRLFAAVSITAEGPRFELELLDARLATLARVVLPAEQPTGADDWVQVVTRDQELVVSPSAPRVAVGGPQRATIFDASGKVVFSIPSR
jgi:hypothetical protein